jgi:hypothetical protein
MKTLLSPDASTGKQQPQPQSDKSRIAQLEAENAQLKKELETFKTQQAQASADEVIIREKMAHGLSREQAQSVIKRQRAHDELEKAKK